MIPKVTRIVLQLFFILCAVQHSTGQSLFDNQYDEVTQVNSDIFIVRADSLWGIVDQANTVKIPIEQKSLHLDGKTYHYIFKSEDGKFGFSDVLCTRVSEAIYDSINVFNITNGKHYLKCWKNDISSIFDQHKGLLFTQNCIDFIKIPFKNNLFLIQNEFNKWGLINSESVLQIPIQYDTLILQQNKCINYKTPIEERFFFTARTEEKYGLVDYTNKTILGFEYDKIEVLHENHFIVEKNHLFGSIGKEGQPIIPLKYKAMELFYVTDGGGPYIKTLNDSNLAGILDKNGNQIIEEKYLYDSFTPSCHDVQGNLGRSIEASDGQKSYFFYLWNNYVPVEFLKKEPIGIDIHCNNIYSLPNNKMCIIGGDPKTLCNSSFEFFDHYEVKTKDNASFLILSSQDKRGNVKYGVREINQGVCLTSIIFDRLDYTITEEVIDYFKPRGNETIIAVGHINKGRQQWIISNRGAKEIKD